jgi:eukaryotic-like serine/threonine-protein kinase
LRALARHPSVRFQTATEMRRAVLAALEAPAKRRASRRLIGFAATGLCMALAGVLLTGKVRELAKVPVSWHGALGASAVASSEPPVPEGALAELDPMAGVSHPDDDWARAERGEEPIAEQGEPPSVAHDTAASAAEQPAPEPERPAKPKNPRKRKGAKSAASTKVARKAEGAAPPSPAEPSIDDEPRPAEAEKDAPPTARKTSRRKKKSRMAHVEP